MVCKNCGTQLPEGAAFCFVCGAATLEAPASGATAVLTPDKDSTVVLSPDKDSTVVLSPDKDSTMVFTPPVYQPAPQPVQQSVPVPPPPPRPAPQPTPKKSNVPVIIGIVLVLVVLIALIVAVSIAIGLSGNSGNTGRDNGGIRKPGSSLTDESGLSESNPYYVDFIDADSYILSATDTKYYSRAQLSGMTRQQLYLAEREMYARYGGTFEDGDLDAYFCAKNWYVPDSPANNFNDSRFTEIERVNLLLLRAMLMERDGTTGSNKYLRINNDVEGWVLNFTDSARITKTDVQNLDEVELTIAANEIYARKGYIFEDDELQLYFAGKNWYTPKILPGAFNTESDLNQIERENHECLLVNIRKAQGVRFSGGNIYQPYYNSYKEYIFSDSDKRALTRAELTVLSDEELILARNEIYARYGFVFATPALDEYFLNCSWYYATVSNSQLALIRLNKTEGNNALLILEIEKERDLLEKLDKMDTTLNQKVGTDLFTTYMPAYWKDYCTYVQDGNNISFYEKENKKAGCGHLFTIEFVALDVDMSEYPGSYYILGKLLDENGDGYQVVIREPSDFNCVKLEGLYIKMLNEKNRVLGAIEWASGYTFESAN